MEISFDELKRRIERKIEALEEEKTRLRNDLAVVRKAMEIASEFQFQNEPAEPASGEAEIKRPVGWT